MVQDWAVLSLQRCDADIPITKRLYVKLKNENGFSLSLQEKMATNLGAQNIATLASGHLPMLSQPDQLARILNVFFTDIEQ